MNDSNATGVTKRRSYDRELSREAIVTAAMHSFADRGFAATSVEEIVQAAGYTRGAFYFHFENKLDCFWAVIDHREQLRGDWVTDVTAGLDPDTTTLEEVLGKVFAHFAAVEQGVSEWVLVMVDFFQQHRDEPEVHARLTEVYAAWRGNVARFVQVLEKGGWIPADADPELLGTEVFAYVEGLTAHARLYGMPPAQLQRALISGLVALLTA